MEMLQRLNFLEKEISIFLHAVVISHFYVSANKIMCGGKTWSAIRNDVTLSYNTEYNLFPSLDGR